MKIRITHLSPKTVATTQALRKGLRMKLGEAKAIVEGAAPHEAPVESEEKACEVIARLEELGNACELVRD